MQSNKKKRASQERKRSNDRFYQRLEFYRRLEAGEVDLVRAAAELGVGISTLKKWKKAMRLRFSVRQAGTLAPPKRLETASGHTPPSADQDLTQQRSEESESSLVRTSGLGQPRLLDGCVDRVTDKNPPERTDRNVCPTKCDKDTGGDARATSDDSRQDILIAMRRAALEGSVPAAKLLLTEYQSQPAESGEALTVERAVELLREWRKEAQSN